MRLLRVRVAVSVTLATTMLRRLRSWLWQHMPPLAHRKGGAPICTAKTIFSFAGNKNNRNRVWACRARSVRCRRLRGQSRSTGTAQCPHL